MNSINYYYTDPALFGFQEWIINFNRVGLSFLLPLQDPFILIGHPDFNLAILKKTIYRSINLKI